MPTRLAFERDDWILVEWAYKCIERAAARGDIEPETGRDFDTFRRAILRLPFVRNETYEFSVARPGRNECSFCIVLSEDGFSLERIEWIGSGDDQDYVVNTDFRVEPEGRGEDNPYDLDEWFSMLVQFIDDPEYEILLHAETDDKGQTVPNLAGAKLKWDEAFE